MITLNQGQLEKIIDNLRDVQKAINQNLGGIAHRDDGLLFDALIKTSDLLRGLENANSDKCTDD